MVIIMFTDFLEHRNESMYEIIKLEYLLEEL